MSFVRATVGLRPRFVVHPSVMTRQRRWNSTPQPEDPPQSNPHRDFYKTFGRPIAKNFLMAVATYQIIYWSWLKLESLELLKEKEVEVEALRGEMRNLLKDPK